MQIVRWLLVIPSFTPLTLLVYGYYDVLFGTFMPSVDQAFASVEEIRRYPIDVRTVVLLVVNFGLAAAYAAHLYKARPVTAELRPLWLFALLGGGVVALPIYWANYIVRRGVRRDASRSG